MDGGRAPIAPVRELDEPLARYEARETGEFLGGRDIPEPSCPVLATRRQRQAIRREGNAEDVLSVSVKAAQFFGGGTSQIRTSSSLHVASVWPSGEKARE